MGAVTETLWFAGNVLSRHVKTLRASFLPVISPVPSETSNRPHSPCRSHANDIHILQQPRGLPRLYFNTRHFILYNRGNDLCNILSLINNSTAESVITTSDRATPITKPKFLVLKVFSLEPL